MKKIQRRKLQLNLQTVRLLDPGEGAQVNGARSTLIICPTRGCPTDTCPSFCDFC